MTSPPPPGGRPPGDPKDVFDQSLDLIRRVVEHSCERRRLRREDKEDFLSRVYIKLMEDDYAVIRRYEGREGASFETFLITVVKRYLLDYLDHLWGKWRESAEAHRLGEVAERLEQLINRDGYTFDEACEILRINEKVELSRAQLADLKAQLPPRVPRQIVREESLQLVPAPELPPDQQLLQKQLAGKLRWISKALLQALETLPPDDRLLIKMSLDLKVSEISRIRQEPQKPLYRRLTKIKNALKKALRSHGVRRKDIQEILGCIRKKQDDEDLG